MFLDNQPYFVPDGSNLALPDGTEKIFENQAFQVYHHRTVPASFVAVRYENPPGWLVNTLEGLLLNPELITGLEAVGTALINLGNALEGLRTQIEIQRIVQCLLNAKIV